MVKARGKKVGEKKVETRQVQAQWFRDFRWLSLCEKRNVVFCCICRSAYEKEIITLAKNEEGAFISDGFQSWKKAVMRFRKHEASTCHRTAVEKAHASQTTGIQTQLSNQQKQEHLRRQLLLKKQLLSLRILMRQGMAIRGHTEEDSNFHQLLLLLSEDFATFERDQRYLSPQICDELLKLMSSSILREISAEVRSSKWFAVIADETCDIRHMEQFNVSIRWVDERLQVHEDPVGFFNVPDTSAETLFKVLKDILIRLQLPMQLCRGQTYDGAANMQGRLTGLATRVLEEVPNALPVHCLAHCTSLALQDVSKNSRCVRNALDLVNELLKLVKNSSKRSQTFGSIQAEKAPSNPTLKRLCPTRWKMRTASVSSVLTNYSVLLLTLDEINEESNDDHAIRAAGQHALMEKFATCFGLFLCKLLFSASEQLATTLQAKDITVQEAIRAANLAIAFYERQATDEAFSHFYDTAVKEAVDNSIGEPVLPRQRRLPARLRGDGEDVEPPQPESPKEYFKAVYVEVLETICQSLKTRFHQSTFRLIGSIEALLLDSANGACDPQIDEEVKRLYGTDVDMDRLQGQLSLLKGAFTHVKEVTSIRTVVDVFQSAPECKALHGMLGEVKNLLQIYYTVPVSSSTSERSFSALKRLKTYLRSTMSQERLNHLMIGYVHKQRLDQLNLRDIAIEFVSANERRRNYFGVWALS